MRHIEITDLPSDTSGSLGGLRTKLLGAYNASRDRKDRMLLLEHTLQYVLAHIQAGNNEGNNEGKSDDKPKTKRKGNK